jgi:hypothetical protein
MTRKATLLFLCAAAALLISVPAAFAQQQAKLQKLNPFLTATPDPQAAAATRAALDKNNGNGSLATFNYTVTSSRDGGLQTYSPSDFDASAIFVSPVPDVSIMSHEVAEWMNDPFVQNPVPA